MKKFWAIFIENHGSLLRYVTEQDAMRTAERLAKEEGRRVIILEAKKRCYSKSIPTIIWEDITDEG